MLLEIEVDPRLDCRSQSRHVEHDSVANNISDTVPSGFTLVGFNNAKIKLSECDKRYCKISVANLVLDLLITAQQADNRAGVGIEVDPLTVRETCSKASAICLSN